MNSEFQHLIEYELRVYGGQGIHKLTEEEREDYNKEWLRQMDRYMIENHREQGPEHGHSKTI